MFFKAIVLLSIAVTGFGMVDSPADGLPQELPALAAPLSNPKPDPMVGEKEPASQPKNEADKRRYIEDEPSNWEPAEKAMVDTILSQTLQALETAGLDGHSLIGGYQFRRVHGEHIDEELGLVALVNHEERVISLADSAFLRLDGFYIYHELGHVVDRQLNRRLSGQFHGQLGESEQSEHGSGEWITADGFWLRAHGHEDREEATADAFALWAGDQFGMRRPVFAGTPVDTDYQLIMDQMAIALQGTAEG